MVMSNEELLNELLSVTNERKQIDINSQLGGTKEIQHWKENWLRLDREIAKLKQDVLDRMK